MSEVNGGAAQAAPEANEASAGKAAREANGANSAGNETRTGVHIVSAARLGIGKFGGSLAEFSLEELGVATAKAAIERAGIEASEVDSAVYGNVLPNVPTDLYVSRKIALGAGAPDSSIAFSVNRICGSGLQAIVSAAQQILDGDATVALAGGVEKMSDAPFSVEAARFGKRMGEGKLYDWMVGALTDPFGNGHMGITAENVAADNGITRERQDEFALESQRRAAAAREQGVHEEEIVGIETRRNGFFKVDEGIRETSIEKLASLKPAFKEGGTVTAGNASGLNDGAASLILASDDVVKREGLQSMARIVSWGFGGVDPSRMGLGPVQAVPRALEKAGLSLDEIDLIESNEAFAAQALGVQDALGFDPDKTNIYGGAVAHGHPIGATGAILTTKLVYALKHLNKRYGLVTLCIGGGQGIAMVVENEAAVPDFQ